MTMTRWRLLGLLIVLVGVASGRAASEADPHAALIEAVTKEDTPRARELLARGADPNTRHHARPLLMHAVEKSDVATATALLDAGALPNARGRDAVRNCQFQAEQFVTPLLLAIVHARRCPEMVELLLSRGADVEGKGRFGQPPLFYAAAIGPPRTVAALLARGARPNGGSHERETPLMRAAWAGDTEILRMLLRKGARVNSRDWSNGFTPLLSAALRGRTEVAQLLIAAGAKLNPRIRLREGWKNGLFTPLIYAADGGYVDMVEVLLAAGADPFLKDYEGKTALDHARENGDPRLIRVLERAVGARRAALGN